MFFKHTPYILHIKDNGFEEKNNQDNINWKNILLFLKDMFINFKM